MLLQRSRSILKEYYAFPDPAHVEVTGEIIPDLVGEYAESMQSLLDELERLALDYERDSQSRSIADAIRRVLHKIKGESGVMGVDIMSDVFHRAEQVFEQVDRKHRSDLLLRTHDWASDVLRHLVDPDAPLAVPATVATPKTPKTSVKVSRARDIMKTGVLTIGTDVNIYDAISTLVSRNITGLPVIGRDLSLAGILSEKDVLRLLYDLQDTSDVVSTFMTREVVSFDQNAAVSDIVNCFMANNFRRVTILEQGRLVGIISRKNILAAHKAAFEAQHPELADKKKRKKLFIASDIMKAGLGCVFTTTPIYDVIDTLVEMNVTGLPVVNRNMKLAGLISEKDLLKLSLDLEKATGCAEDYMSQNVVAFSPDDSLVDICDCLIENPFRRVPIVENGRLVGIVSRRHMIAFILQRRGCHPRRRRAD